MNRNYHKEVFPLPRKSNLVDTFSDYFYSEVAGRLRNIIMEKNIKQEDITKKCKDFGLVISQSTISKILKYKEYLDKNRRPPSISLSHVVGICKVLEIETSAVLAIEKKDFNLDAVLKNSDKFKADSSKQIESFIFNPEEDAFKGYLGEYYCYFHPTISTENTLLRGKISFAPDASKKECEAKLTLFTNDRDHNGEIIKKYYHGRLIISLPQSSCYCVLSSAELGEINMFTFHHRYFHGSQMYCRLAATVTTSAGDTRRPTMHRMFICRENVMDKLGEDFEILISQLLLHNSEMLIRKDNLPSGLPKEIEKLIREETPVTEYYSFRESKLYDVNIDDFERLKAIFRLRQASASPKYNKIGSKSDEITYHFLRKCNK
jgi:hypothetical protein